MAYIYRHIRKDKNEVFYIGAGFKDDNYRRAYSKRHRNSHWNRIVLITDYEVEIIIDNIDKNFACEKEIEFIELYGKRKNGGTLCNIADGGIGGNLGEEVNKMMSKRRQGHNNGNSFKVYQYSMNGDFVKEWGCVKYAADHYSVTYQNITNCLRGKQKSAVGFKWSKIKLHED